MWVATARSRAASSVTVSASRLGRCVMTSAGVWTARIMWAARTFRTRPPLNVDGRTSHCRLREGLMPRLSRRTVHKHHCQSRTSTSICSDISARFSIISIFLDRPQQRNLYTHRPLDMISPNARNGHKHTTDGAILYFPISDDPPFHHREQSKPAASSMASSSSSSTKTRSKQKGGKASASGATVSPHNS